MLRAGGKARDGEKKKCIQPQSRITIWYIVNFTEIQRDIQSNGPEKI